jgi:hypothetical protein
VNIDTLPKDGRRYLWVASWQDWSDASCDPSCDQYWSQDENVYFDEPVIVENTYYGKRQNMTKVQ